MKILIVDDDRQITKLLDRYFTSKGYTVMTANGGPEAVEIARTAAPQLAFIDVNMPGMDGFTTLRELLKLNATIKAIMISGDQSPTFTERATAMGAVDFIVKPFQFEYLNHEVLRKVNIALFNDLRQELAEKDRLVTKLQQEMEKVVKLNTRLRDNFYQTIVSLAAALEARDQYTHGHSERVAHFSGLIARELQSSLPEACIDEAFLEKLYIEAKLHDVGKIAIPDAVLNKPGSLNPEELELIRTHPVHSSVILEPLHDMTESAAVIRHHHERYDGKGYPAGLSGPQIPLRSRIIAVADSYDAMTSNRPYRKGIPRSVAIEELIAHKGSQFDPNVTDAFLKVLPTLE